MIQMIVRNFVQKSANLLLALLLLGSFAFANTEFGTLQGANFRIDVPDQWNHILIVYYHGYDARHVGGSFDPKQPANPVLKALTDRGYAVIQSGYSKGGWAVEQALPETEALRQYFVQKYGQPTESYVAGHSMGGFLTTATIESHPERYVAGLDLCGAVASPIRLMTPAFDQRVVFDYFFPGTMPPPNHVPADFALDPEAVKHLLHVINTKPAAAATMRRIANAKGNQQLAWAVFFATYVIGDIEARAGGNPFDNRNTIYTGTGTDPEVNDKVGRYAADPGALDYLQKYQTLTGDLTRPVLAVHTTYDELVPQSIPNGYSILTRTKGAGDHFVQQYVKADGHCNISPNETATAFEELRHWKDTGEAPKAGWLNVPKPAAPAMEKKPTARAGAKSAKKKAS